MEDFMKIAYLKIFEGTCSLVVNKYGMDNPCIHCPFYGCSGCEKERLSKQDEAEILEIETIILEKIIKI